MPPRRSPVPAALLLTPGAGADRTHHTLVAIEKAVKPRRGEPDMGLKVGRVDFPYRKAGKVAPDKAPAAVAHLGREAAKLVKRAGCAPEQLVLGGRSYGGRMCSMAVAEGLPAAGLVLLSYPLHPPGKPDNLRVDHFGSLHLPCLFVGGTKDPFGSPAEFDLHVAQIPGPVTQVWIEGAGHDVKDLKSIPRQQQVIDAVAGWLAELH